MIYDFVSEAFVCVIYLFSLCYDGTDTVLTKCRFGILVEVFCNIDTLIDFLIDFFNYFYVDSKLEVSLPDIDYIEIPATWWDTEADKSLLIGVHKHGKDIIYNMLIFCRACFSDIYLFEFLYSLVMCKW